MKSALEQSIQETLIAWRNSIRQHDRAVLIGFWLCCIPFLPTTLLGLTISLFNYRLYKRNKLPSYEKRMIQWAIAIGLIFAFVSITLFNAIDSLSPLLAARESILTAIYQFAAFIGDAWHHMIQGFSAKETSL